MKIVFYRFTFTLTTLCGILLKNVFTVYLGIVCVYFVSRFTRSSSSDLCVAFSQSYFSSCCSFIDLQVSLQPFLCL